MGNGLRGLVCQELARFWLPNHLTIGTRPTGSIWDSQISNRLRRSFHFHASARSRIHENLDASTPADSVPQRAEHLRLTGISTSLRLVKIRKSPTEANNQRAESVGLKNSSKLAGLPRTETFTARRAMWWSPCVQLLWIWKLSVSRFHWFHALLPAVRQSNPNPSQRRGCPRCNVRSLACGVYGFSFN